MLTMKRGALYGAALTIGILIGLPAMPGSGFVPAAQAGVIDDIVGAGRAVGGAVKDAGKRIGHDAKNTGKIIGKNARDWGTSVGAGVKDIGVGFYDHVICNIPATNCHFNPPGATPLPPKPDAPRVHARPGKPSIKPIIPPRIRDARPGANKQRVRARPGLKPF